VKEEIDRLIGRIFQDKEKSGHLDLEATELSIRHCMHQVGGVFLEKLLNADAGVDRGSPRQKRGKRGNGKRKRGNGVRQKRGQT
jgi:hypothetical protein